MAGYVTVREAALIKNVTRQAIYLAIRLNKLRAYKQGDSYKIFKIDLDAYDKDRYSRATSTFQDELIFDDNKGIISVGKAAKILNVSKQKIYYACRVGQLKAIRKKTMWVINVNDLFQYESQYLRKNFTEKQGA